MMTNATGRNDEGMKQRRNYRVSEKGEIKNKLNQKVHNWGEAKWKKEKNLFPPISSTYKINTNSTDVAFGERIIRESKEKTRFAHTRVTNQDKFEQEVTGKEKRKKKNGVRGKEEKKKKRKKKKKQASRQREREREREKVRRMLHQTTRGSW